MTYIYSYRNKKISAYNPPIFSPIPKEGTAETVRRACILQPQEAKQSHLDECDLYLLGEWDDVSGKFFLLDEPEYLLSLDQFFVKEDK